MVSFFNFPGFALLGSYKIFPVYDDPDKLYDYRRVTDSEFQHIKDTRRGLTMFFICLGVVLIGLGFGAIRQVSHGLALAVVLVAVVWLGYLDYSRGGVFNLGTSMMRVYSSDMFKELKR